MDNYKSCRRKSWERGGQHTKVSLWALISKGHNGLISGVEIIFIDKTDPSDPTRREEFWRTKFKTLAPYGLNVEEWLLMSSLGSFKFAHFNYPAMYYVTECQFLKCFVLARHWRTKIMYVIQSPLLKVFEQSACWLYGMFVLCLNQPIKILAPISFRLWLHLYIYIYIYIYIYK